MKLVKVGGILVLVLAVVALGFMFAAGPQPHIVIAPEILWHAGPLPISDTLMGAWLAMFFIFLLVFASTRSMKLIPSGMQNFIEGFLDFLLSQVEEIAGRVNGRRFFPVVATFFLFILIGNWSALLPFYKSIGITHDYGHEVFEEIAHYAHEEHPIAEDHHYQMWDTEKSGSIGIVKSGAGNFTFELHAEEEAGDALDRYIVALAEHFTDFERETAEEEHPTHEEVEAAAHALEEDPAAPKLLHDEAAEEHVESPALGESVTGIDFPGKKLTIVYPFFRPAFSDMNNTVALALIAFVTLWYWGFTALGFRGYMGKFFIAPWKSPIMTFVGFLELLSEFIRVISFSFRLFGNIFAGSVLLLILTFLVPFFAPLGIYGLELFVGLIQAIVFSLLVLVFGVGAVTSHHEDHDEHGDGHHEDGGHDAVHHQGAVQAH